MQNIVSIIGCKVLIVASKCQIYGPLASKTKSIQSYVNVIKINLLIYYIH